MKPLDFSQHVVQPTWISLIGVGFLLLVALVIVTTVLVAARNKLAIWEQIKSALAVLIWVLPATYVVAWIGMRSDSHFRPTPAVATARVGSAALVNVKVEARDATFATHETPPKRLVVRETLLEDPKWSSRSQTSGGRELACLTSQHFATLTEAEEQITREALTLVKAHYKDEYPMAGELQVPVEIVDTYAVKDLVGEVIDKDFGKMYRAHLRLDFSPELRTALDGSWRGQTARQRLMILGSLLGLVTLMLGTSAGYFRLDDATAGAYRGRLKLAAASLVTAGSLVAIQVVRMLESGSAV